MRTIHTTNKAVVILLLLLSLVSGCGSAPPEEAVIIFQPSSLNLTAGGGATPQPVSLRVATSLNESMNDVEVTISGNWADPFSPALYHFYDENGALMFSPFKKKTDKHGMINFTVVIPDFISTTLSRPTIVSASTISGGGILAPGTYTYAVTALVTVGQETNGSPIFSATTTTVGGVDVVWTRVTGATGYNVYGRTAPEQLIFTTNDPNVLHWIDDGTSLPLAGFTVPVTNTTSTLMPNAFTSQIEARSGSIYNAMEIKFQ